MARRVDEELRRRWRTRMRRFRTSELTVVDFCDVEQISTAAFYQWQKRLAAELVDANSSPVDI